MPPKAIRRRLNNRQFAEVVVSKMRKEDWMVRHGWFARLLRTMPILCEHILDMMSPDEMMKGRSTGQHVMPFAIALRDRRRRQRQTTLMEHGFIKTPRR